MYEANKELTFTWFLRVELLEWASPNLRRAYEGPARVGPRPNPLELRAQCVNAGRGEEQLH
jgi:hypothetical protein